MVATQLIEFLRTSVGVQDSESTNPDSEFVSMSYEELETLLMVVVTRDFPEVQSLDSLPTEYIYPVVLLAKKELYYVLASKYANKYDLGADNNNYLKRSQMYDHYLKLIEQVDKEYKDYQENGQVHLAAGRCDHKGQIIQVSFPQHRSCRGQLFVRKFREFFCR